MFLAQRMEDHHFVDTVDELRTEVLADYPQHQVLHMSVVQLAEPFLNQIGTEVRGHDDYRITEVDRSPLPVGETPVVEYLQQNVEHIRVRFFHFIQQDDGIRTTAHRLGQVTALFIADVSRRRTDQTRDGVFLHKLGHIDTHHCVVAVEHKVSQRFTQLGFTDPGWTEEQERTNRPVRIGQPGAAAANGVGYRFNRLILANHPMMQLLFHTQQFVTLAFHHAGDRDTGPASQHFGDFSIRHFITQQTHGFPFGLSGSRQLFLQFRNFAVLQLGHPRQIADAARLFDGDFRLLQLSFDGLGAGERRFFRFPLFFQHRVLPFFIRQLLVEHIETLQARLIRLFLQRLLFQFQLDNTPIETVQLFRFGVNLHTDAGCRLIDEVDGFIRQLTVGNIAMR